MWPQRTQLFGELPKPHNTGKRTLCINVKKTAEKMNPRIMCIGSFSAISRVSPLRSKTGEVGNKGNSMQYQSFLHMKVVHPELNSTSNCWHN